MSGALDSGQIGTVFNVFDSWGILVTPKHYPDGKPFPRPSGKARKKKARKADHIDA